MTGPVRLKPGGRAPAGLRGRLRALLRPGVAAVLFAVLGATALILSRRGGGETLPVGRTPQLAGGFDALEVYRQGTRTRIRDQGGQFKVTVPVAYPADQPGAKAAFDSLAALDFSAVVTDRPERFAELEVDDAKGVRVSAREHDREVFALVVGKSAGAGRGTFVRVPGANGGGEVWLVDADLHAIFDRSPADWRDRTVTTFAAKDARGIQIEAGDGARILLRSTGEAAGNRKVWQVVESSVTVVPLDELVPNQLVTTMASLKASDFADGVSLSAAGLDSPTLVVTVSLVAGAKAVVLVGKASGTDDVFVKTTDGPQIFLVKRFNVERFGLRPLQFRDKVLCDIADGEIVEVAVRNGDNSYVIVKDGQRWKAARPPGLEVDSDKVAPFASIFRGWRAPSVAENPPSNALSRPWAEIVGKSKIASCTIRVGIEGTDGTEDGTEGPAGYFVKTPRSSDVYLVPKWMIERVVVKLSEIRKT